MKLLSVLGVGVFMVTSLAVGTRLFLLWRRTHQLPELLLTITLWCVGGLGFALGMIARLLHASSGGGVTIAFFALVAEYVGCGALAIFAWRVFHPGARWAAGIAFAVLAVQLAALVAEVASGQVVRYTDGGHMAGPFIPLGLAARALGPAWLGFESFRYYSILRRRLRLGLAERAVVHRVALWGMATSSTAMGYAVSVVHRAVYGTGLQAHGWALGLVSAFAFVSAIGIGLAFFPPPFYRRWAGELEEPS